MLTLDSLDKLTEVIVTGLSQLLVGLVELRVDPLRCVALTVVLLLGCLVHSVPEVSGLGKFGVLC